MNADSNVRRKKCTDQSTEATSAVVLESPLCRLRKATTPKKTSNATE
jgi:hypothetical protein